MGSGTACCETSARVASPRVGPRVEVEQERVETLGLQAGEGLVEGGRPQQVAVRAGHVFEGRPEETFVARVVLDEQHPQRGVNQRGLQCSRWPR
jgi:hypothetical protein